MPNVPALSHFDFGVLLLHLAAIALSSLVVLWLDHRLGPADKGRRRVGFLALSFVVGTMVWAVGLFDSGLLRPFDWLSLGCVVLGTMTLTTTIGYLN